MATVEELIALAEQRAAMEIETWIPLKPGDRIAGVVQEVGSITTKFGDYYTTTLRVLSDYIEDGKKKSGTDKFIRVAWMGAVLKSQFERMVPCPDDIASFHYQKDASPANGMNDYALIESVVIDPRTERSKMPVNLRVNVPTWDQVRNADPRTGELATVDNRFILRPGEQAFGPQDTVNGGSEEKVDSKSK